MMQASSVTCPSSSGRPPYPTDCDSGSASGTRTPASTASSAEPFCLKTAIAASFAGKPWFQVEITIGFPILLFIGFLSLLINADGATNPAAPVFIKLRRFIIIQKQQYL